MLNATIQGSNHPLANHLCPVGKSIDFKILSLLASRVRDDSAYLSNEVLLRT